jgi:hypothetical protein
VELYLHFVIRLRGMIRKHRYNFTSTLSGRVMDTDFISEPHFMRDARSMEMEHMTVLPSTENIFVAQQHAAKRTTALLHSDCEAAHSAVFTRAI